MLNEAESCPSNDHAPRTCCPTSAGNARAASDLRAMRAARAIFVWGVCVVWQSLFGFALQHDHFAMIQSSRVVDGDCTDQSSLSVVAQVFSER